MEREDLFAGKVALVTGAGRGIGRAEALAFARYGAKVVVNDLARGDPIAAALVVEEIRDGGGEAAVAEGSVSRAAEAERIVAVALNTFGRLDFLVNNAGFGRMAPIWDLEEADWNAVLAVNLTGTFLMSRAGARAMRRQRSGVIVNTASEAANGDTNFCAYMAAKAGVVGLTRGIARDLMRDNVRCNAVTPRAFDTGQANVAAWESLQAFNQRYGVAMGSPHPMGPVPGKSSEVAEIVAWLCTEDAAGITGRTFVAGCGEVGVWNEPTLARSLIEPDGWTLERLHRARNELTRHADHPFRELPDAAWAEIDARHSARLVQGERARAVEAR